MRRYYRLPGSVDEPFLMVDLSSGTATNHWVHQDRQGAGLMASNDNGGIVGNERYVYDAYGNGGTSAGGFPFRYTGQKLDPGPSATPMDGLYYYKARYYDPQVGRFLQTDPIGYQDQQNLYAYVANDPVNMVDPTGKEIAFAAGSTDQFKRDFTIAVLKAVLTGNGEAFGIVAASSQVVTIKEGTALSDFYYDPGSKELVFHPRSGLEVSPGNVQSPALGVLHELGHAANDLTDPTQHATDVHTPDKQYGNVEERKVIEGIENPAAVDFGEPTRNSHGGREVEVKCITCTEIK